MTSRSSIIGKALPALFLLSVFSVGSVYGFFVHRSQLFPYRILKEAESAYAALTSYRSGKEPTTFLAYVPEATPRPSTWAGSSSRRWGS